MESFLAGWGVESKFVSVCMALVYSFCSVNVLLIYLGAGEGDASHIGIRVKDSQSVSYCV